MALDTLEQCVKITSAKLLAPGADYDDRLASHVSWLAKGLVATLEAARKLEATQTKAAKKLSPKETEALIRGYINELPKEKLTDLLRYVQELAPEGSVL